MDYKIFIGFLQVSCNVRGKLDSPCNAVGYVDREVMGISHMYQKPAWKRSKVKSFFVYIMKYVYHSRSLGAF